MLLHIHYTSRVFCQYKVGFLKVVSKNTFVIVKNTETEATSALTKFTFLGVWRPSF